MFNSQKKHKFSNRLCSINTRIEQQFYVTAFLTNIFSFQLIFVDVYLYESLYVYYHHVFISSYHVAVII